ncbi:nucleotide sugar dehydrogenase [Candidatus Thioglobus sp.]|nr:nucleotide sugar dehydrogenase [Candidatus Thioglobus sp.]MDA8872017.1 nucleotide sugar dehydrogenase [Candidatus Thioglobus sp.]
MNNSFKHDVVIIGGLGHIGLPLGIVFASKGLKVCLNDINNDVAKIVNKGEMPYVEYGAEPILKEVLANGKLVISLNPNCISDAKYVIIAIGTPVDEYLNPKTRQFLEFIKNIKQYLSPNQVIIVRSSVFPQSLHQIMSILGSGENWHLAYCPERIVQGFAVRELETLPQIVSGFTDYAIEQSEHLFLKITNKVIKTSMSEAELAKLFSNSWRYIQFAIANQFYMISESHGVDYNRIREIMIDGYDRSKGLPSAGFAAGPCLLKDTMQLSAFNSNQFQLGQAAMNINEGLPNYIVDNLSKEFDLSTKTIGILGMAFKADVDDIRDSLSYKLRKILIFRGAKVLCCDDFVSDASFITQDELIEKSDIVIIGAPHESYGKIDFTHVRLINIWE